VTGHGVAAWVGDDPVSVDLIEARLATLRRGRYSSLLPDPRSAEGRNLRRWLVQVVTMGMVVEREAAGRAVVATDRDGEPRSLSLAEALRTGGVCGAVLAVSPLARALRRHLLADVDVPAGQAFGYYTRNRDRYPEPYEDVRGRITDELREWEHDKRFAAWLSERHAALVRTAPGFEHPGDPHHPDAVHRH
jgi:[acyl-carrier-protein] S-malonyltransferase